MNEEKKPDNETKKPESKRERLIPDNIEYWMQYYARLAAADSR